MSYIYIQDKLVSTEHPMSYIYIDDKLVSTEHPMSYTCINRTFMTNKIVSTELAIYI